jgi:hypothetical protein
MREIICYSPSVDAHQRDHGAMSTLVGPADPAYPGVRRIAERAQYRHVRLYYRPMHLFCMRITERCNRQHSFPFSSSLGAVTRDSRADLSPAQSGFILPMMSTLVER